MSSVSVVEAGCGELYFCGYGGEWMQFCSLENKFLEHKF